MRDVPFADTDVDERPAFLDEDEFQDAPEAPTPTPSSSDERFFLPPSGSGIRARRRRQQRRRVWRRGTAIVLVAVVVLGAALTAIVLRPWDGGGDRSSHAPAVPALPAMLPSSAVLVQQDAQGAAGSITVFVANPSGSGGHVVLVPPATMSEIPSFGLDGVGRALSLGGPPLLQVTLENLLGVGLPPVVIAGDAQVAAFVQPAGPLDVQVPERVEQNDPRGAVSVLWEAGLNAIAPADAPRFLATRGSRNDLSRLARQQWFWTAYLARIVKDPSAASALPPQLSSVIKPLAAGPVSYEILPVEAVDAGSGGDEVYRVRQGDLDQLVGQLLPGTTPGARVRVQVLNGTGVIGAAQAVARRLVPAGGRVVLSGNADSFAYAQTQIVFYDRSRQQAAARVRQALGTGRLVLSRQPLDVVDVTVVVGKDFNG